MRVISRRRMREFWESDKDAEKPLLDWERLVKTNEWANWGGLKQTCNSADLVGNCTVFDVGHNRWRLIARVMYGTGIVYVLKIMRHSEYDRKDPKNKRRHTWENDCRCHQPPPKRKGKS